MLANGHLDHGRVGVREDGRVVDVDQLHGEVGREALGRLARVAASVRCRVLHHEAIDSFVVEVDRRGAQHSLLRARVVRHGELVVARAAREDAESDRVVGAGEHGVLVHEGEAGDDHARVAVLLDEQHGRRGRLDRGVVVVLDVQRHGGGARERRHAVVRGPHAQLVRLSGLEVNLRARNRHLGLLLHADVAGVVDVHHARLVAKLDRPADVLLLGVRRSQRLACREAGRLVLEHGAGHARGANRRLVHVQDVDQSQSRVVERRLAVIGHGNLEQDCLPGLVVEHQRLIHAELAGAAPDAEGVSDVSADDGEEKGVFGIAVDSDHGLAHRGAVRGALVDLELAAEELGSRVAVRHVDGQHANVHKRAVRHLNEQEVAAAAAVVERGRLGHRHLARDRVHCERAIGVAADDAVRQEGEGVRVAGTVGADDRALRSVFDHRQGRGGCDGRSVDLLNLHVHDAHRVLGLVVDAPRADLDVHGGRLERVLLPAPTVLHEGGAAQHRGRPKANLLLVEG
mmetsp:Transcript_16568/g.62695  ORF Transcript_16568/g.62695 Transcript_16568/m.62695 type:complete len:514 (-) Transcript_16568:1858-3399(-)